MASAASHYETLAITRACRLKVERPHRHGYPAIWTELTGFTSSQVSVSIAAALLLTWANTVRSHADQAHSTLLRLSSELRNDLRFGLSLFLSSETDRGGR